MVWFVRVTGRHNLDPILERLSDGIIGVSDATRRRFSAAPRVSARYRMIVDGADMGRFHPPVERAEVRALGLPLDRFVLLFVGQIKVAKGVLDIVDAMGSSVATHPQPPRPLLLFIGTPDSPAIIEEIWRRARALSITEDVRVLPQQTEIERWFQAADVLVSGSHQDTEGLSRVLFEAMACGAVPIATDIHGNREAISPETGVIVPERCPDAIARAVSDLMAALHTSASRPCGQRGSIRRDRSSTFDATRAGSRRSTSRCSRETHARRSPPIGEAGTATMPNLAFRLPSPAPQLQGIAPPTSFATRRLPLPAAMQASQDP